uniref:Uncharacterized protein n=1 Tax=Triticum urartu TaxID=4572 RepID=A0A8R7K1R9_TRIUA
MSSRGRGGGDCLRSWRLRAALVPFPCLSRFAHAFLWPCSSRSGDFLASWIRGM